MFTSFPYTFQIAPQFLLPWLGIVILLIPAYFYPKSKIINGLAWGLVGFFILQIISLYNIVPFVNNMINATAVVSEVAADDNYEMIYEYEDNFYEIEDIALNWNILNTFFIKSKGLEFDSFEDAATFYTEISNMSSAGKNTTGVIPYLIMTDGTTYWCSANYYASIHQNLVYNSTYTNIHGLVSYDLYLKLMVIEHADELDELINDCDIAAFENGSENWEYIRYFTNYFAYAITYQTVREGDALSSLETGEGICYNYAYALAAVLQRSGYENVKVVFCEVDDVYHAITSFDVDGETKYADPTAALYFMDELPSWYELTESTYTEIESNYILSYFKINIAYYTMVYNF